jgi:pimeloyl-ACP methyl ester carboxylesterase
MHYVTAGDENAAPVVLLHGFPRSWFEWRHVIPALATNYRVVAPDLRGSGDSSKPSGGFDKRTMAGDVVDLLDHLGLGSVHVVGRDWGAPTALAVALHWKRARTLTFIENVVPGFGFEEAVQPAVPTGPDDVVFRNGGVNHVAFHLIPDLPELLIQGREREYFTWFLTRLAYNVGAIDHEVVDECVRCMSMPGALRCTLGYTRSYYQDGLDNRRAVSEGRLTLPVLGLGGAASTGLRAADSLKQIALDVEGDVIPSCGHWVSDEQPEWLARRILSFLEKHREDSSSGSCNQ